MRLVTGVFSIALIVKTMSWRFTEYVPVANCIDEEPHKIVHELAKEPIEQKLAKASQWLKNGSDDLARVRA